MRRGGFFIFLYLAFLIAIPSRAQLSCTERLTLAQEQLDLGRFYSINELLKSCIEKEEFTREQEAQAYLLLTRVYLYMDDPDSVDINYLKLLGVNPEHTFDADRDPIDMYYLSEKYTTRPVFSLHLGKLFMGFSSPDIIHEYGVYNTEGSGKGYSPGFGIGLGAGLEWHFFRNFSLVGEIGYNYRSWQVRVEMFEQDLLEMRQSTQWIDVPVYLKYSTNFSGKFKPYFFAGLEVNSMFSSRGRFVFSENTAVLTDDTGNRQTREIVGPDERLESTMRRVNRSMIFGAGVRYKFGFDYIFGEVRLRAGMNNVTNPDGRFPTNADDPGYYDSNIYTRYAYVPDDFRINQLLFSIGYIKPLYKPRLKSPEQNFFQRLFNKK